jgi:hypothetical protein
MGLRFCLNAAAWSRRTSSRGWPKTNRKADAGAVRRQRTRCDVRCATPAPCSSASLVVGESRSRLVVLSAHTERIPSRRLAAELSVSYFNRRCVREPPPQYAHGRTRLLARRRFTFGRAGGQSRAHPRSKAIDGRLSACTRGEARWTLGNVRSRNSCCRDSKSGDAPSCGDLKSTRRLEASWPPTTRNRRVRLAAWHTTSPM